MRFVYAAFLSALVLSPVVASAQEVLPPPITNDAEAAAFLALFEGNWRGRGESRAAFDDAMEDSQCNLNVVFDAAATTLTNDGRCANTQGGADVDGALALLPGGVLTGGFFSRFERAELLSSSGQILQDRLFVEATYTAEIRRQVQEIVVQVWVSRPAPAPNGVQSFGMIVQVRNPETGEFVDFSNMVFQPRG